MHQQHKYFKFLDWELNDKKHQLLLNYEIEMVGTVTEVLTFPKYQLIDDKGHRTQINAACELIHLMCGVSYYKSGLARSIIFEHYHPTEELRQFVEKTWKHGLAELAYENNVTLDIDLMGSGEYDFHHSEMAKSNDLHSLISPSKEESVFSKTKSLVAIGGGKDSLVTIEELKQKGNDITLFMVGGSKLIKEVSAFTTLPLIQVHRKIDRQLLEYNRTGEGFNGHVPITAINSSIGVLTALLFDFDEVVFSNERSADFANTTNKEGDLVNHQYSKSMEFETDLSDYISSEITQKIKYYSQQRAFSELAILEKFSHYPQYFPVFSSCNRNFHIDGSHNKNTLWCGNCPKCRFVFLGLAPFVEKKQLLEIFDKDLLDDLSQKQGFEELLGIKGFKPFECVGEIRESQMAFNLIKNKADWQNDTLIQAFSQNVPELLKSEYQNIMKPSEA